MSRPLTQAEGASIAAELPWIREGREPTKRELHLETARRWRKAAEQTADPKERAVYLAGAAAMEKEVA